MEEIKILEDAVMTPEGVLLVEWADVPEVMEIVDVADTGQKIRLKGLKPQRIITHLHEVLTEYNGETDRCSLDALADRAGSFLVSVSRPSAEAEGFHWYCHRIGAFINPENVDLIFPRPCTEEESAMLDGIFPAWRMMVEDLTMAATELASTQTPEGE